MEISVLKVIGFELNVGLRVVIVNFSAPENGHIAVVPCSSDIVR